MLLTKQSHSTLFKGDCFNCPYIYHRCLQVQLQQMSNFNEEVLKEMQKSLASFKNYTRHWTNARSVEVIIKVDVPSSCVTVFDT